MTTFFCHHSSSLFILGLLIYCKVANFLCLKAGAMSLGAAWQPNDEQQQLLSFIVVYS